MSFNLWFYPKRNKKKTIKRYSDLGVCSCGDLIDFGIQTPTNVTMECLKLSKQDVINRIRTMLEEWDWGQEDIDEKLEYIQKCLNDPDLELTYI